MDEILRLDRIGLRFGGVRALNDVSFKVDQGEIIGLIGPNGAGKTTLVNVITGVQRPGKGRLFLNGIEATGRPPHRTARMGIARTFQIVQPFSGMSALDNVAAAFLFSHPGASLAAARAQASGHLEYVGLQEQAGQPAGKLTLAMRKRLELAKALAMRPKLLCLDEVNSGLNTAEMQQAAALIKDLSSKGITIILIEHLMKVVLNLSTRLLVLNEGQLIADGDPSSVVNDPQVVRAYLGAGFAQGESA